MSGQICKFTCPVKAAKYYDETFDCMTLGAILDSLGKPFANPEVIAGDVFVELKQKLNEEKINENSTLFDLDTYLEQFLKNKRTWVTRMPLSNDETQRIKAAALKEVMLKVTTVDWQGQIERLADKLISHFDREHSHHCGAACDNHEALKTHRESCLFRPLCCPNGTCFQTIAALNMDQHDTECIHKKVQCATKCGVLVARKDMKTHLSGPCPKRPVECPFAWCGCPQACTLGDLQSHVESPEGAVLHLSLMAQETRRVSEESK